MEWLHLPGTTLMKSYQTGSAAPKLGLIKNRIELAVNLAIEKAALHTKSPAMYPLPSDQNSIENALIAVYNALPLLKKNKLFEAANKSLNASSADRQHMYGDLLTVDFKSASAITEQVKNIPLPDNLKLNSTEASHIEYHKLINEHKKGPVVSSASAEPEGLAPRTISVFADSITCNSTDELIKDEINLAAFAIDALGNHITKAPFFIGKFKKGETINLGAKSKLFDFDLRALGTLPQSFVVSLVLIEDDILHNTDLVNKLINLFIVIESAALVLGGAFIFVPGVDLITPILLAVAGISIIIFDAILPWLSDDISNFQSDKFTFSQPDPIGDLETLSLSFQIVAPQIDLRFGKYTTAIRWARTA